MADEQLATEEVIVDEVTDDAGTESKDDTPQAVKDLAKELGWNENFSDNPDKYVDAATYIRRSRDINSGLRKQIKEITNVVTELKSHNERVFKAEVKRLTKELDDLKAQRKSAIEEGDVERVEKIEAQMDDIKEKTSPPPPAATTDNPFDEWLDDNPWYRSDEEMRKFADKAGAEYEGLPYPKILKLVRKDVEAAFPDKFKKASKQADTKPAVSPVESGSRKGSSSKRTVADLSPTQRKIMNQFVSKGVMSQAEYIADLVKAGEI